MKRLTSTNLRKACNDPWDYCGLDNVCKRDCFTPSPCKIPEIIDRLAAYEDTGLEPEEINEMKAKTKGGWKNETVDNEIYSLELCE